MSAYYHHILYLPSLVFRESLASMASANKSFGAFTPRGRTAHLKGPQVPQMLIEHLTSELSQTEPKDLKALVELGAVYVNKERVRNLNFPVTKNDIIRVHLEPKRYDLKRESIQAVFENENFVILDKPSGLPMHATLDNAVENLAAAFSSKLFVTHRLDVPTSGLVVLAKTKNYQKIFNDLLAQRKIEKHYQALTLKSVALGVKRHFMIVDERAPKTILTEKEKESDSRKCDECLLEILSCDPVQFNLQTPIPTFAAGFNVKIKLMTGRTHQIRAQLAALGSPLVGDEMYGGMKAKFFGLHACGIEFIEPVSQKKMSFRLEKKWEN